MTALEGWARKKRPTELLYLMRHDVGILMFDGTHVKVPGDLVYEHVLRRQPRPADAKSDEGAVSPRSFPARSLRSVFEGAVKIGKLEDKDTLHQAKPSRAGRAKLLRLINEA